MKTVSRIILWFFSVVVGLLALAFFTAGAMPGFLMLAGAVLLNPVFIDKIRLKKGLTAFLVIALFIASVAILPEQAEERQSQEIETQNGGIVSKEQSGVASELQLIQADMVLPVSDQASTSSPRVADTDVTTQIKFSPTPTATFTPKPTPTPTATFAPKPTPTLSPTPSPVPSAAAAAKARSSGIVIIDYTDVVSRGEYASIQIQGEPNTAYICDVKYKSGPSTAKGIGEKMTDGEGHATWSWKVGTKTSLDYTPSITIHGGGDSVTVSFDVVK